MSEVVAETESPQVGGWFARAVDRVAEPRFIGPIVGAAAVALGLYVVHDITHKVHLDDITSSVAATTWQVMLPSLAFTIISFLAMSLYDVMALARVAPGRVPARLSIFAGLVGYGISNAIGFHIFVGGPVRYRIYQGAGLDAADVGRIVGISFLTFTGGLLTILGAAMVLDPVGLPWLQILSTTDDRIVGGGILCALVLAIGWLSQADRQVTVLGWNFPLPTARSALAQILVGAVDIGTAAAALYVLLPADVAPGFAQFLVIFVVAILASVISHAPGGLGVMEAAILLGLGAGFRTDVVAALVVFRLIYYGIPLMLAVSGLICLEVYRSRERVGRVASRSFILTRRLVPPIAATLNFIGGMVLLLSGNTPADGYRTDWLSDILPLPFAEASHLLASMTGLLLVVVARGLYRRIAFARLVAIVLLSAGAVFSLLKGLDWEEAVVLSVMALLLFIYRDAFYRKGDWRAFRPNATWIALMAIVFSSFTLIGFLAYHHVDYRSSLWWQFSWDGDASRFLRATAAMAVMSAAIAADALINRPAPTRRTGRVPIPEAVREILKTTDDTQPCVALLGDKSFLVSTSGKAFLMYVVSGGSWITMGDPVGDAKSGQALIWRFAEEADRAGARAVFYSVQPRFLPNYVDMNLALLKIGEVARIDLTTFSLAGSARQPLRYADGRATREGIEFSIIPAMQVKDEIDELKTISDAWLSNKSGSEKSFSLGYFDPAYMCEFDCAVLRKDGKIVAFSNLWRSGDKNEFSVDLMRYLPGVSPILMDALFAKILLYAKQEGYLWFNLGAAPLAGLANHPLASTWNRVGTFIYKRGDEFYNFEGLRAFKQKFDPVWTPQYLACPQGFALPQILLDITTVISGSPIRIFKR